MEKNSIGYLAGKILLTLYLYCISYFYSFSAPWSWTAPVRLLLIYGLVHVICGFLQKVKIPIRRSPAPMNWRFGICIFFMAALSLGIYYAAYYPGGICSDSFNQWYQVQKGFYVDWHPVIHTFLFMKLPSLIWNNLAFVNLLQLIWLSLACAYLGMVMERWGICKAGSAAAIGGALLIPASAITLSFCWKDTALTLFCILIAAQVMEIVCSEGLWLKKTSHIVTFAAACALAMLMRHNGVLLIGPLVLLLTILYWKQLKKYCLMSGVLILVIVAGIKGPFYRVLRVQNHSQVSAEMLGVPMTILSNVLVNEPEKLDPECREFLYEIGDQQMWEEHYKEGSWNSAKYMGDDISNDVIEEVGTEKVLLYTWHAVQRSPYYSYRAVVRLFDVVWKPFSAEARWAYNVEVDHGEKYGYTTTGVLWLQRILDTIRQWSAEGGLFLTWGWNTGFYILLLMFAGVSRLKGDLKKLVYWLPVLAYDFGTALLLCGSDFRFFSFNTVLTFALVVMILSEKEEVECVE